MVVLPTQPTPVRKTLTSLRCVEDLELEAKSRVRSQHAAQLLPGYGFAVDDQQGHLLDAVGVVGDLPAHHILLCDSIAAAFGLDVPATKLPSDTLKERLEGDEQVLFRLCDHREFVALGWSCLQGFERQLVAEDMRVELEGVGHAVEVLEGQRIERDMLVVESEVLGYRLVVTLGAHKLCPLLVPDRDAVVGRNIGSAGAANLGAHYGYSVRIDTAEMLKRSPSPRISACTLAYTAFIRSRCALPGRKWGTHFAGTAASSPVAGLRPVHAGW